MKSDEGLVTGSENMTTITIDSASRARFRDFKEVLQLVDESGKLLGLFTPNVDPSRLVPQIDEAEIERRLKQGGGRPLADILHDLESRQ
jgi:hypothetical protein